MMLEIIHRKFGNKNFLIFGELCIQVLTPVFENYFFPLVPGTYGPLARDVDSLVLAMRALWDGSMNELDPLSPPVKFQNEVIKQIKTFCATL